jgi:hypothetical protein
MAEPQPQITSMSKIKSKLLRPALTSNFLCEFAPPNTLRRSGFIRDRVNAGFIGANYDRENQELITLSCSEASLPGSSLATHEINNDFTGVTERHAYRRQYDDRADFTFYVDLEYRIIDFFENWMSYIVGEDDIDIQKEPNYSYRVNFPNTYKTDNLYITKFEKDYLGRQLTYQFINAYPISVNSMPVSYDASQLLKCTVSFTYSRYVITRPKTLYDNLLNTQINRENELRRNLPQGTTFAEGGIDLEAFIRNNPPVQ